MQDSSLISNAILDFEQFVQDPGRTARHPHVMGFGVSFTSRMNDFPVVEDPVKNLRYVTDWLHLWQLVGHAAEATCRDFSIYMQVVAIVFADPSDVMGNRPIEGLIPPVPAASNDRVSVRSARYLLPSALTQQMFTYCSQPLSGERRKQLTTSFLQEPFSCRTKFL
ncbi:MAG: hypothetical protein ABIR57_05905 [Aeromicrobium sp.]